MSLPSRILLISNTSPEEGLPLGIGYLHSNLEKHGFSVGIFHDKKPKELLHKAIKKKKPFIIGIQIISATRSRSFELIDFLHTEYPDIQIIIGGIHTTALYKQLINKYPYIIAVLGEGETTIVELANALQNKHDLASVKGIAYMQKQLIQITESRDLIENLDDLPFPKRSLFLNNAQYGGHVLTSRGCPFNCSFCALHHTTKGKTRFRSIENIIQELEYIQENYPKIYHILLLDETFFVSESRVIDFCEAIRKKKLHHRFRFSCFGRADQISEKSVAQLEQTNFYNIRIGLESGNDEIRKRAHKLISKEDFLKVVTLFAKNKKVEIFLYIIIGLPGETDATIKETGVFIQKLQKIRYIHFTTFPIASAYTHTELYENMKKAGKVTDAFWLTDTPEVLYTLEHSEKKLQQMRDELRSYVSLECFITLKGFFRQFQTVVTVDSRQELILLIYKQIRTKIAVLIKKYLPTKHNK